MEILSHIAWHFSLVNMTLLFFFAISFLLLNLFPLSSTCTPFLCPLLHHYHGLFCLFLYVSVPACDLFPFTSSWSDFIKNPLFSFSLHLRFIVRQLQMYSALQTERSSYCLQLFLVLCEIPTAFHHWVCKVEIIRSSSTMICFCNAAQIDPAKWYCK